MRTSIMIMRACALIVMMVVTTSCGSTSMKNSGATPRKSVATQKAVTSKVQKKSPAVAEKLAVKSTKTSKIVPSSKSAPKKLKKMEVRKALPVIQEEVKVAPSLAPVAVTPPPTKVKENVQPKVAQAALPPVVEPTKPEPMVDQSTPPFSEVDDGLDDSEKGLLASNMSASPVDLLGAASEIKSELASDIESFNAYLKAERSEETGIKDISPTSESAMAGKNGQGDPDLADKTPPVRQEGTKKEENSPPPIEDESSWWKTLFILFGGTIVIGTMVSMYVRRMRGKGSPISNGGMIDIRKMSVGDISKPHSSPSVTVRSKVGSESTPTPTKSPGTSWVRNHKAGASGPPGGPKISSHSPSKVLHVQQEVAVKAVSPPAPVLAPAPSSSLRKTGSRRHPLTEQKSALRAAMKKARVAMKKARRERDATPGPLVSSSPASTAPPTSEGVDPAVLNFLSVMGGGAEVKIVVHGQGDKPVKKEDSSPTKETPGLLRRILGGLRGSA